jgi:hypothetical protein
VKRAKLRAPTQMRHDEAVVIARRVSELREALVFGVDAFHSGYAARSAGGKQAPMQGTDDLALLLTRCAAGERLALEEFYRRTAPAVFARVLRLVRDRGRAEEILQETYISVWRNAGRYDRNAGAPMTWVASIARYRALDVIQKRRSELSLEEASIVETEADPAASPLDAAMASA